MSLRDLQALESQQVALDERQLKRLFEKFGTITPEGKMLFNYETWNRQAIWTRAHFKVSTCSNHIEGFHRALNEATHRINDITNRLHTVIECIVARYETAKLYSHTQGTKLLKKLTHQQQNLKLGPRETCTEVRCGWKAYYTALMNVKYFPCVHEVGFKPIEWYQPEEEPSSNHVEEEEQANNIVEGPVETEPHTGEWAIPEPKEDTPLPEIRLENEWYKDSETICAFICTLVTEILYISRQDLVRDWLIAALSADYMLFLIHQEEEENRQDSAENRSNFRVLCWCNAKNNNIKLW
jgi:hypothetical protein